MIDVHLERSLLIDVPTHTPDTGCVASDYELVTRITAGGAWVDLTCPSWQAEHQVAEVLPTQRQAMSLRMAQKLIDFCARTYVVGNYDFDCHSFVGFVMGWQDTIAAGSVSLMPAGEAIRDLATTVTNEPYIAHAPNTSNPYAHSFIGTERRDYGLGVVGSGLPLVISHTENLRHTVGATELFASRPKP